jgi:hypothetical protein
LITKNLKRITGALILCCLVPGVNSAEYAVLSPGSKSCDRWLQDRESFIWVSDIFWVSGWISAAGYYDIADLEETDSDAMAAYLDKYCQANPLSGLADAAAALVDAIKKSK